MLLGVNFALFCIEQEILRDTWEEKKSRTIGHGHPVLNGGVARGARLISHFPSQVSRGGVGNHR